MGLMSMAIVDIPKGRYYSPQSAADEIGVTIGRMRQMIRWGEIDSIRISDRAWIISEEAVRKAKQMRK